MDNVVYMPKGPVGQWLEAEFLNWQLSAGRSTVTAFAEDYLKVSRDTVNKWMNGTRVPRGKYVVLLAEKLNPSIYGILPTEDPRVKKIIAYWGKVPDETKEEVVQIVERAVERAGVTQQVGKRVAVPERVRTP